MGRYESEPGVPPVRITTFRRQRKLWRRGYAIDTSLDEQDQDFFRDEATGRG